jgi:large subunit ribosomal protein L28
MSKICPITGKRPIKGNRIHRKGQPKKSGGIGTHVTKVVKRTFKPNLQRIRICLETGEIKRVFVSTKALKAGKIIKV